MGGARDRVTVQTQEWECQGIASAGESGLDRTVRTRKRDGRTEGVDRTDNRVPGCEMSYEEEDSTDAMDSGRAVSYGDVPY